MVLLDNPYQPDPRVKRHLDALIEIGFKIHLICTKTLKKEKEFTNASLTIYRILTQDKIFQYYKNNFDKELEKIKEILLTNCIQIILANDHICLELAVKIQNKLKDVKIIYDAHEFISGWPFYKYEKRWIYYIKGWAVHKVYKFKERKNLNNIHSMLTVSEGLKYEYLKINPSLDISVVRNIPPSIEKNRKKNNDIRVKLNLSEEDHVLVHSGNLYYQDKLIDFLMNEITLFPDNFKVLFLSKPYDQKRIKNHTKFEANKNKLLFVDFVPYNELNEFLKVGTAGLILNYKPKWKSHWYSLPNRIFDYLQAELPLLSTEQPEFKRIIREFEVGTTYFISKEPGQLLDGFNYIISNTRKLKDNIRNANKGLSWEKEKINLVQLINKVE